MSIYIGMVFDLIVDFGYIVDVEVVMFNNGYGKIVCY